MTKELQSLQRQAIQQANKLPSSNAFGATGQAFSQLGQLGAFAAQKVAVSKAQQAGAEAAMSGEKRDLMPGLTKATQAFNEAYNNVDASLVTMQVTQDMQKDLSALSQPGKLNSDSVAEFNEFAKNRIKGALEAVNPQVQATVGLRLTHSYGALAGKMAQSVEAFNQKQAKDSFTTMLASNLDEINEMRMGGDLEGARGTLKATNELIDDYKTLGFMTQLEEFQARKQLNMQLAASDAQASYLESVANGTEEEFLAALASKKPEGLSNDEWLQAQSEVLKLKSQQDKLTTEQESLSIARWNQKIVTGEVSTLAQLENAAGDMSAINYIGLQNKIMQQQLGGAKNAAAMQQFIIDNTGNPGRAARASNEVKNAAYDQLIDAYTQAKIEQTGDPSARLSMQEKAQAVQAFNVPIDAFNVELGYALQHGDDVAAMDAALAYQELAGTPGGASKNSPVLNLNSNAQKIAVAALFRMNYGTQDPTVAIQSAREAINNKDDVVRAGRMGRYDETFGKDNGIAKLKSRFKDALGVKADDNPVLFEAYQRNLRENTATMTNVDEALEMTKRSMSPLFSVSKYGPNKKVAMELAPEKNVAMIEQGAWFDNQMYLAVNKAVKDTPEIEFVGEIPADLTQDKIFSEKLGKPRVKVNGREHDVYLMSDPSTGSRASGRLTYGLYYKDANGFSQPIPDTNNPLGVAEFQVMPFEQFLPSISNKLTMETHEQVARKEAAALFDRENLIRKSQANIADLSTFGTGEQGALIPERQEFIDRKSAEIVEKLTGLPYKKVKERRALEKKAEAEANKLADELFAPTEAVSPAGIGGFGVPATRDLSKDKKKFIKETTAKILRELVNE